MLNLWIRKGNLRGWFYTSIRRIDGAILPTKWHRNSLPVAATPLSFSSEETSAEVSSAPVASMSRRSVQAKTSLDMKSCRSSRITES